MKIRNDRSTIHTLNELRKNSKTLAKQQSKVSTGMKIVGAGDGASEYAISERMRANIRGLNQAIANVATGKSMINVASEAIDQQVSIMRQIATRTMQASDDTYTDKDRLTLNKEISQLLDQSDDIATQTTYNGIHLLDQRRVSSSSQWFDADAPYHANPSPVISLSILKNGDYRPSMENYVSDVTLDANGSPTNLYNPASVGAGTQLTAAPGAGEYVWSSASNQALKVSSVSGTDATLSDGTTVAWNTLSTAVYKTKLTSVPAVGTDVAASSTGSYMPSKEGKIAIEPGSDKYKVAKGSGSASRAEIDFSELFDTTGGNLSKMNGVGFSMTCSGCPQYVSVQLDTSTSESKLYIGEKSKKNPKPMCYVIGIAGVKTKEDLEEAVYNGLASAGASNRAYSGQSAAKSLDRTKDSAITIAMAHHIQLNYFANTGKFSITKNGPSMTYQNGIIGKMVTDNAYKPEQLLYIQPTLKGSQNTAVNMPNTTLSILFPSTSEPWDITPGEDDFPKEYSSDYSNYKNEAERRLQWKDTEWPYPSRFVSLDKDHTVDTRDKANAFLDDVHQAIKYLLYANTTLGAQANRLDYTSENLVTSMTNTQASESAIRDADMAKEMTDFVKANVLSQSAQSMLSQANNNTQGVLSLLQ